MDAKDVLKLVQNGEKLTLEYKKAWNVLPTNLFETICAFLNRDGGIILLGVNDDGTITNGVDIRVADQLCKNIANLSNNNQKLNPTFLLQPEIVMVSNAQDVDVPIIVIQIPSSSQVHQSASKIYDRSRDGDFEVRTDAERSALYRRKSLQYSENKIFPYLKFELVTLDNYVRHPKNPHMANFFVQLGWAEHLGTGIRNIYKYTSLYTDKNPRLDDEDLYTATIPLPAEMQAIVNETIKQKELQKTIQSLQLKLTKNQFDILSIIVANNVVNRYDIMTQLHIPESSVISCISALKRKGILVRVGGKRYGKWSVNL